MGKQEFLALLRDGLSGLPQDDAEERLTFYCEMLDDRIEDDLSEEEAVAEIGPVDTIVSQTLAEIPLPKLVRERVKPKRSMRAWEIVFLVLGSPIWLSLLIALAAVIFSVYIVIWAVILSLWAVELAIVLGFLAGIAAGIVMICKSSLWQGVLLIGSGILLAGLAILLFYGFRAITSGAGTLTAKIALGIKSLFVRKEN